ncbi:MAG: MCE family protein [Actinophytocola sp.]|nr:MCE family protein [Actinophytocola sp.]
MLLARLRHQALGLAFLLVAALFFAVTIGIYTKAFANVALVNLDTDFAGNQLREGADVKVRGMVVGEVKSISSRGDGADIELALDPARLEVIPADVTARLLPKTLFGERYVALRPPERTQARPIKAGDVIGQDRSKNAIELERVLDNLVPLLRAVEPQKLASTLNAVATTLDGRGEQLGETLTEVSKLLGELNPTLPDFKANLAAFNDVARTYSAAMPDLLDAMSELTTTSETLVAKQRNLHELYSTVTAASTDLTSFFELNQDNLIALTHTAQGTLDVLAKYSPQYPCMLRQLAEQVPEAERAFGKGTDHPHVSRVKIEMITSRGAYQPGVDEPRYDDKRGPRCYPVVSRPDHWPQYPPDGPIDDGASKPPPPSEPDGSEADDYEDYGSGGGGSAAGSFAVANSPMEQELIAYLSSPAFEDDPERVPGWASLLVGPLYRGAEVQLRWPSSLR